MNFFVALEGPSYGANRPPVVVSDAFCYDEAYGEGLGHVNLARLPHGNLGGG